MYSDGPTEELRTPPHSDEAEAGVLCAMMIDAGACAEAISLLDERAFYREANRRIFRAMKTLWERSETVDVVTLIERLRESDEIEAAGGIGYVSGLLDATPTSAHVDAHARVVRDRAALRSLIEASTLSIRDAYDVGDRSVSDVIGAAENRLIGIAAAGTARAVRAKERLWTVLEEIEDRRGRDNGAGGILTGLYDFDRKTLGLHAGDLVVVGARPSMGKSALAMTFALSAALGQQVPTAVFSFEMPTDDLMMRALAVEARLDLQALRSGGDLSDDESDRLAKAAASINVAPLWIDDSTETHIGEVAAKVRRLRHQEQIGLVVVDYLQLMQADGRERREQIDSVTRKLKLLAKSLSIPVVLLCQLSRGPESRTSKRPMMSDLRESGGIEQDADSVVLIYRPEYYASEKDLEKNPKLVGLAELIVAKQRNGPTGVVRARFDKRSTRFENLARAGGPKSQEEAF